MAIENTGVTKHDFVGEAIMLSATGIFKDEAELSATLAQGVRESLQNQDQNQSREVLYGLAVLGGATLGLEHEDTERLVLAFHHLRDTGIGDRDDEDTTVPEEFLAEEVNGVYEAKGDTIFYHNVVRLHARQVLAGTRNFNDRLLYRLGLLGGLEANLTQDEMVRFFQERITSDKKSNVTI